MNWKEIKIFDSLTHVKQDGSWYDTDHDSSLRRLLNEFDEEILNKALLVGMPGDNLDYILNSCRQNKDRLIPVAALEFGADDSFDQLEEKIANLQEKGFKGIKIHPRMSGINLADKRIQKAIGIATGFDMVSMLCTVHKPPSKPLGRPVYDVIHEICDVSRKSKLILMHGGYYEILQVSEIVRSFENVLLDVSATIMRFKDTHIISDFKFLFQTFDRRLCIGSDFPEYTMSDVLNVIELYDLFDNIDQSKIHNILYNNLIDFWRNGHE